MDVAATISYMDPFNSLWWSSKSRRRAFPDVTFPLSLESLCSRLLLGGKLSQKGFLMHDPQDVFLLGVHCQHGLQQHPMLFLVFERPQSGRFGMLRIVEISGILDQQHPLMRPCLGPVCWR